MLELSSERPQAVWHGLGVMELVQAMCMAPQERVCTCMYLAEVSGGSQSVSSGEADASWGGSDGW